MIGQLHQVIQEIEHEWSNKHLLVVGDVMLDKYIWGEVGRISPEAPVPVVRGIHQNEKPGGAANVAMNMAHLGAQTVVAGFTGTTKMSAFLPPAFLPTASHLTSSSATGFRPSQRPASWAAASRCFASISSA